MKLCEIFILFVLWKDKKYNQPNRLVISGFTWGKITQSLVDRDSGIILPGAWLVSLYAKLATASSIVASGAFGIKFSWSTNFVLEE